MKKVLAFLAVLVPVALAFGSFFRSGPLAWGDAPHFYPEGLTELFNEPSAWTARGITLGGINHLLWISPLMLLMGTLHKVFGLGNDVLVRLLFYFPSLILSFAGPVMLARELKFSKVTQFFAGLFYVFNTYYLLLVDGGVVGVALAYGVFPFTLLFFNRLFNNPSYNNFWLAFVAGILLASTDPRIFLICALCFLVFVVSRSAVTREFLKLLGLKYFILIGIFTAAVSAYWIVPLVALGGINLSLDVSGLNLFSLLNSLLLYQPHWPANIFGEVAYPAFYFTGVPILLFGSLAFGDRKKILPLLITFLVFAFLAKGATPPFGVLYETLITKIPFGTAFRDSSKFFIPMTLLAGIMIGETAGRISQKLKSELPLILIYGYLLFLVFPALIGKMNFVLSGRNAASDFGKVYENLKNAGSSFRTAWLPEKHPLAFETSDKPALDAKDLAGLRPLARLTAGTFDRFNYMHDKDFLSWYKLLGIKYLILSGDPRKVTLTEEETANWQDLRDRTATVSGIVKEDWGVPFDVYRNDDVLPRIFAVKKIAAIVGPEVSDEPVPAVYFEDGKLDSEILGGIASESAVVVFNGKEKLDLQASFLQKYFNNVFGSRIAEWAKFSGDDYLLYKFQLLIRDFKFNDFDYGRGIAFSTEAGEKIAFEFDVPKDGTYFVAVRVSAGAGSDGLSIKVNGKSEDFIPKTENFGWYTRRLQAKPGKLEVEILNKGGLSVFNVAALIDEKAWQEAERKADIFVRHFGVAEVDSQSLPSMADIKPVDTVYAGTNRIGLKKLTYPYWIVMTDNFNPLWKLQRDMLVFKSVPIFSMSNAFYKKPDLPDAQLVFGGQEQVRFGIYWTALSALALIIGYLYFKK